MCDNCWREAGSPTERTPNTDRLVKLIEQLYEIHCVGGPLHVVLDDWNVDVTVVEPWYDGYSSEELDALWYGPTPIAELSPQAPAVVEGLGTSMRALCDEIAALLNGMTVAQRYAALAYRKGLIPANP